MRAHWFGIVAVVAACDSGSGKRATVDATPIDAAPQGSGVPGDTRVVAMTPAQLMDFCEYVVEGYGPQHDVDCGMGSTVTVGGQTVQQCMADGMEFATNYPSCEATVAQYEACLDVMFANEQNWCSMTPPPECESLFMPSPACGG